ncbi:MAG: ABC transporter ATP-binding protein [Anaerolineales bacterium]|nr:ABC transporter ATP-binding protein [Anaerolineales bacterium]
MSATHVTPALEVVNVSKAFGGAPAVDGVSFTLAAGEVLALLGPSGSGKSTLLGLIAGLEAPDTGEVRWAGKSLADVPIHARGFGLMFQDYALFPHKDVAGNVGFGLRMRGQAPAAVAAGVRDALALVGLRGFERRDVNTLSGGEQQRVALARALAPRPQLLLLDEPLGALDRALRERLLEELGGILRQLSQTTIYVTHDQEEAFALADRVLILRQGRVAQAGAPAEVYARPASRFVAEFLGWRNLLPARLARGQGAEGWVALTDAGQLRLAAEDVPPGLAGAPAVTLGVRAEALQPARPDEPADLEGTLVEQALRGSRRRVTVRVGRADLLALWDGAQPAPALGAPVRLRLGPRALTVLPEEMDRLHG